MTKRTLFRSLAAGLISIPAQRLFGEFRPIKRDPLRDRRPRWNCFQIGTGIAPFAPPGFTVHRLQRKNNIAPLIGLKYGTRDKCVIQLFGDWESVISPQHLWCCHYNLSSNPIAPTVDDFTGRWKDWQVMMRQERAENQEG